MARSPATNLGLLSMAYGLGVIAGGTMVLRMWTESPIFMGVPFANLVGWGLAAAGGGGAIAGALVVARGPRVEQLLAIAGCALSGAAIFVAAVVSAGKPILLVSPLGAIVLGIAARLCIGAQRLGVAEPGLVVEDITTAPPTATRFPRWAALLLGPLVGALVGARGGAAEGRVDLGAAIGAGLGLVAGAVLLLRPSR